MSSAWTGKPCQNPSCGRKKGKRQADQKYCYSCARLQKAARSQAAHGARIEDTYGITAELYAALYEFQGGRCALCRWATGKTRRLSVDHDHKCQVGHDPKMGCPECVRGLLCRPCNNLLGVIRDSVEYLRRAIDYLLDPPFQRMRRGAVDWSR